MGGRSKKFQAKLKNETKHAGKKKGLPQFTMRQEARSTGQHLWYGNDSKLRHGTIKFVNAGALQREDLSILKPSETKKNHMYVPDTFATRSQKESKIDDVSLDTDIKATSSSSRPARLVSNNKSSKPEKHVTESAMETSEDEVVFSGRTRGRSVNREGWVHRAVSPAENNLNCSSNDSIEASMLPATNLSQEYNIQKHEHETDRSLDHTSIQQSKSFVNGDASSDDASDILNDYIANMDKEDEEMSSSCRFPGTGRTLMVEARSTDDKTDGNSPSKNFIENRHDSSDLYSDSDANVKDYIENAQLNGRDDYSMTPSPIPTHLSKRYRIRDDDDEILKAEGISDKFIWDPDSSVISDDMDEVDNYIASQREPSNRPDEWDSPLSASAIADIFEQDPLKNYGDFDVLDFTRPSVQKKLKGLPRALNYDLSDSDLASNLQNTWANDKKKKKVKKQQRQELREQGLLGKRRGRPDLGIKYSRGFGVFDLKNELREFLLSHSSSLSLPPMTKKDRKSVHEIANVLSLKSVSKGYGPSRYPTLTKTKRTPQLRPNQLDAWFDQIYNGPAGKRDFKQASKPRGNPANRKDGEVVGESAPEISAENKGRMILEKMGWSSGTALGSSNNKGILKPVTHVVKKSKAGLG